jgi:YbbR domain-containing protein
MKRGVVRRIGHFLFENFWWKVLSLAVAVVIWALVASEPELSAFSTVRLEYKNLPDDLEISSEPVTSVVLELRGPSGVLHSAGNEIRPSVVLDMSDARPGERTYTIANGSVRLARGIRLVRAIPSEVRFTFEPRGTRTVPVEVRFLGQGQNSYEPAHVEVNPPQVQIVGPRSRVARVTSAVTDQIDLTNVVGTAQFHVNVFVEDPYIRLEGSQEVTVQVTMKKKQ